MKWLIKEERGGTLALTLIVMLVLSILGFSLLSISVAEAKFAANQLNNTQAYFVARSGAEVGLKTIMNTLTSGNHQTLTSLYAALTSPVTGSVNAGEDSFSVTFIDGGLVAQDQIKILSTGTANSGTVTTALTVRFSVPFPVPLDWLNPGGIIKAGTYERTTSPVIVNTVKQTGHGTKKSTELDTVWKAPSIHFVDDDNNISLEISGKTFEVQANLVSFFNRIYMKKNEVNSLVFNTFNAAGFKGVGGVSLPYDNLGTLIPNGWGVVKLNEMMFDGNLNSPNEVWTTGYYAVAPGTDLSSSSDRTNVAKVIQITNTTTQSYIDSVINTETGLSFDPQSKKWTKN